MSETKENPDDVIPQEFCSPSSSKTSLSITLSNESQEFSTPIANKDEDGLIPTPDKVQNIGNLTEAKIPGFSLTSLPQLQVTQNKQHDSPDTLMNQIFSESNEKRSSENSPFEEDNDQINISSIQENLNCIQQSKSEDVFSGTQKSVHFDNNNSDANNLSQNIPLSVSNTEERLFDSNDSTMFSGYGSDIEIPFIPPPAPPPSEGDVVFTNTSPAFSFPLPVESNSGSILVKDIDNMKQPIEKPVHSFSFANDDEQADESSLSQANLTDSVSANMNNKSSDGASAPLKNDLNNVSSVSTNESSVKNDSNEGFIDREPCDPPEQDAEAPKDDFTFSFDKPGAFNFAFDREPEDPPEEGMEDPPEPGTETKEDNSFSFSFDKPGAFNFAFDREPQDPPEENSHTTETEPSGGAGDFSFSFDKPGAFNFAFDKEHEDPPEEGVADKEGVGCPGEPSAFANDSACGPPGEPCDPPEQDAEAPKDDFSFSFDKPGAFNFTFDKEPEDPPEENAAPADRDSHTTEAEPSSGAGDFSFSFDKPGAFNFAFDKEPEDPPEESNSAEEKTVDLRTTEAEPQEKAETETGAVESEEAAGKEQGADGFAFSFDDPQAFGFAGNAGENEASGEAPVIEGFTFGDSSETDFTFNFDAPESGFTFSFDDAKKESLNKEDAKKESLNKEDAKKESPNEEDAKKESPNEEDAKKESPNEEDAKKESLNKEDAKKESPNEEDAKKESLNKEDVKEDPQNKDGEGKEESEKEKDEEKKEEEKPKGPRVVYDEETGEEIVDFDEEAVEQPRREEPAFAPPGGAEALPSDAAGEVAPPEPPKPSEREVITHKFGANKKVEDFSFNFDDAQTSFAFASDFNPFTAQKEEKAEEPPKAAAEQPRSPERHQPDYRRRKAEPGFCGPVAFLYEEPPVPAPRVIPVNVPAGAVAAKDAIALVGNACFDAKEDLRAYFTRPDVECGKDAALAFLLQHTC